MKIVFLNGGLANQAFQYLFFRYAELTDSSEEWLLDDSFFFTNEVHNGYELDRVFGVRPRLISEHFDRDVWEYMIGLKKRGKSIPQIFLDNGEEIAFRSSTPTMSFKLIPQFQAISKLPLQSIPITVPNDPGGRGCGSSM